MSSRKENVLNQVTTKGNHVTPMRKVSVCSFKNVRDYNEDRYVVFDVLEAAPSSGECQLPDVARCSACIQQLLCIAVIDGHGGEFSAEFLAKQFQRQFMKHFLEPAAHPEGKGDEPSKFWSNIS